MEVRLLGNSGVFTWKATIEESTSNYHILDVLYCIVQYKMSALTTVVAIIGVFHKVFF